MDHFRRSKREISLDAVDSISDVTDEDFIGTGPDKGTWNPTRRPAEWMIDSNDPLEQMNFGIISMAVLRGLIKDSQ